ncbi:hypothetical protein U14_03012 [Candidatus Moduliflexus flocculans]|uniref:Uncharacterized protein n=1 Tax=Candidatus Moduliflexus flocculans TaxID=1499966 RepID=A0A081BN01_9BACT|nr:hypothetical protein U14_03012 [Candidatus Moduliflexus flocculans]
MAVTSLFSNRISALRRRIFWQNAAQFLLFASLSAGSLYTLLLIIERSGWLALPKDTAFYSVIGGLSAIAALIAVIVLQKPLAHRLIEFDTRLRLHDELSTAYEYQRSGKSSLFAPPLIEHAGQRLGQLNFATLQPFPLLKFAIWGGALLLIHLALLTIGGNIFPALTPNPPQQTLTPPETAQPEKLTTSSEARRKQHQQREQRELFQKMNDFAKALEQRELTKQEFAAAVNDALQDLQSQQEQLLDTSENGQTLDNAQFNQVPLSAPAQQMRDLLARMLQRQNSQDSSNIATVSEDELNSLREALSQMAQQADQGNDSGASEGKPTQSAGQNGENSEKTASSETPEEAENQPTNSTASREGNGDDQHVAQGNMLSGNGRPIDQAPGMQGQEEKSDGSASAGLNPGDNQKYAPSELETSKGQIETEKTAQAVKNDYSAHIRSVTRIGNANAPTEEVIRPYQQELESVLQQEKLPLNYREYIKNYFLAIGVTAEQRTTN